MEIGPRDVEKHHFVAVRRDNGDKVLMFFSYCYYHVLKESVLKFTTGCTALFNVMHCK